MTSLITDDITVQTQSQNTYAKARLVKSDVSYRTIKASIQPMKGSDLNKLPEGETSDRKLVLYSPSKLNDANDSIIYEGYLFKIIHSEHWKGLHLSHYKYIISETEKINE